jgi:hypothetical protein
MIFRDTGERMHGYSIARPRDCQGPHGPSGYVPNSYRRPDGKMVCGACGMVIEIIDEDEWHRKQWPIPLPDKTGGQ